MLMDNLLLVDIEGDNKLIKMSAEPKTRKLFKSKKLSKFQKLFKSKKSKSKKLAKSKKPTKSRNLPNLALKKPDQFS